MYGQHFTICQVYKTASQLRQEVKQKAKRAVDKHFLAFKLSQLTSDGIKLSVTDYNQKAREALEARIKFLKDNYTFHHGNLEMPNPELESTVGTLCIYFVQAADIF